MPTEVLYRKWRPRTFAEVAGQENLVRTLTNAVSSGKFAHAYLFSGPRGTGKTTSGRLLAKAVNCTQPKGGEPCNECESCRSYLEGRALDLIELDAASNRGIDEIRNLREKASFAASGGQDAYKVYLVDEVHMLTEPAFNALLKTLEEPPPHVIFVLATTESHKVPATVASRCQRFDFRRIPLLAVVERLTFIAEQEGVSCPPEAFEAIARMATGSLRDAINLLEQLADSYGNELTVEQVQEGLGMVIDARSVELAAHALRGDLAEGLALISSVRDDGIDLRQFQRQVVAQLRGLLLAKAGAPAEAWSEEQRAEMRTIVADVPAERIVATLRGFGEADLRADPLSPLPLELALASASLSVGSTASAAEQPPAPQPAQQQEKPAARPKPAPRPQQRSAPQPAPAGKSASANGEAKPAAEPKEAPKPADRPEEAAPKPAPAPAATGSVSTESAREHWPEIYQRTRELHHKAGALLNSGCGIIEASDAEITFGFQHKMLLDRMQGDGGENLRALQQAIDDVLGSGIQVRCVLAPDVDVQRPKGGHLVRAAEEMGGQLLPSDG